MTYSAGEALFLTRLQAMTQFTTHNSARGKWGILNSGESDHYAILRKGPTERVKLAPKTRQNNYQTIIQLWQRYVDDGTSYTNLLTLEDAVLDELDKYRQMGDTTNSINRAEVSSVGDYILSRGPTGDGPLFIYVELVGSWYEEETITYA